jgi:small conductance mechanosensitive channel
MRPLFLLPANLHEWHDWLRDDAPKLIGVIIVVVLVNLASRPLIGRVLTGAARSAAMLKGADPAAAERRVRTLQGTLTWLVTIVAGFIGGAVALDTLGLNITPLVAGVGIVGLAFGLGAQTLIKDVINGIFILIEDQFAVGDQVTVAGIAGEVIEVNPRRTLVRDASGAVHSIPNSAITTATNRSPALRRLTLVVEVPFREAERTAGIVDEVVAELAGSTAGSSIMARPKVASYAVDGDGEGDARLYIVGEVRPADRWSVEGEIRRRLSRRCGVERIAIAFPVDDAK